MSVIILRGDAQKKFAIQQISSLNPEKLFQVEIKLYREPRSLDQNALIHYWFGIIARETGNDPDDIKEALKAKFLPARFVEIDDQTIEVRRSTAKLNKAEMVEFVTRIQAWAATELAIVLPTRIDRDYAA